MNLRFIYIPPSSYSRCQRLAERRGAWLRSDFGAIGILKVETS
jgi:hypothetical protein